MNETKKLIITLGLFGFIGLGMLIFSYLNLSALGTWGLGGEESLAAELSKLKKDKKSNQKKIDKIQPTEDILKGLEESFNEAKQLLPQESSPQELITFINSKATEAKVVMTSLVPKGLKQEVSVKRRSRRKKSKKKKRAPTGKYEEWTFSMKLTGTYDQLGTFINLMEEFEIEVPNKGKTSRFFEVKGLSIGSAGSGLIPGARHKCSLVMKTYKYVPAK